MVRHNKSDHDSNAAYHLCHIVRYVAERILDSTPTQNGEEESFDSS